LPTLRSESIRTVAEHHSVQDSINLYKCAQGISERLSELAASCPPGRGNRDCRAHLQYHGPAQLGLTGPTKAHALRKRDQAEWLMKPAMLAVPGVAHVIIFGARCEIRSSPISSRWRHMVSLSQIWRMSAGAMGAARSRFSGPCPSARADPTPAAVARSGASPTPCWRCGQDAASPSGDIEVVTEAAGAALGRRADHGERPGVLSRWPASMGATRGNHRAPGSGAGRDDPSNEGAKASGSIPRCTAGEFSYEKGDESTGKVLVLAPS